MGVILQFQGDTALDQDAIDAMLVAFNDICRVLNIRDDATTVREVIASQIVELARRGERSPANLRDRVLAKVDFSYMGGIGS